jgi:hypothetical protein
MLSNIIQCCFLFVIKTERRYAKCYGVIRYAESRYAESRYAESRYAESHYAECHYT